MKIYKLSRISFFSHLISTGTTIMLESIAVINLVIKLFSKNPSSMTSYIFLIVWLFIIGWLCHKCLTMAFEVWIQDNNSVWFRSLVKQTNFPINDIKVIDTRPWNRPYVKIKHSNGSIFFYRFILDWNNFVSTLMSINPSIHRKDLSFPKNRIS